MANQPRYALKRQAERYWALSIRLHTGHGHLPPFIFQNSHQDIISTLAIKHNRIAPDTFPEKYPIDQFYQEQRLLTAFNERCSVGT